MEKTASVDITRQLYAKSFDIGHDVSATHELAAYHIARFTTHRFPTHSHPRVLVVSGTSTSSGIGIITAKHLQNAGHTVSLFLDKSSEVDPIVEQHIELARKTKVEFLDILQTKSGDVIVESVIAGDMCDLSEQKETIIKHLNDSGKPIISHECPSGMNIDTGDISNVAVQPDHTVSMAIHKKGVYENPKAGVAHLYDVGIPRMLYAELNLEYPF